MELFRYVVQDEQGNVIQGASVAIYEAGTATLATIYEEDEATPKTNPLTSSATGVVQARLADGAYDVKVSKGGVEVSILNIEERGAGLVPLATYQITTAVASVEITSVFSGDYDDYMIKVSGVRPATDNVQLIYQVSTDNGSTWLSGASDYYTFSYAGANTALNTTTSFGYVTGYTTANAADAFVNTNMWLYNVNSATQRKSTVNQCLNTKQNTQNTPLGTNTSTLIKTTSVLNAIKLYFSSGNLSDVGTITIYGVKEA